MKRMMKYAFVAVFSCLALVTLSGCVSYHKEAGAHYLMRPEPGPVNARYVTKYQIDQKRISGLGEASVLFGIFQFSEGKFCKLATDPQLSVFSKLAEYFSPTQKAVDNAKSAALFNACENNQADQILGATFEYTISNYVVFASVKCAARGFPARVEKIELQDKVPVILNNWQKVEYIPSHSGIPANFSGPKDAISPNQAK